MMTLAMLAFVDARAADEDGGDRRECHLERGGVDLDEAEPLLIDGMPTAPSQVERTTEMRRILSMLTPAALAKEGVGADGGHRGAGLGVQECPH